MLTAIDPWRLAKNAQTLRGNFSVSEMPRLLSGLALENNSQGRFEWHFGVKNGRAYIQGYAEVCVEAVCQRCLQPMQLPLRANTLAGLLRLGQNEDSLPEDWDPLLIEDVPVAFMDLLEDELILALPLVFRHAHCPSNEYQTATEEKPPEVSEISETKDNPFAVLAQLKNK
jgi:uncharacterized protein